MTRLIDVDALNLEYEVDMADDWKTAHEIANIVKYAPTIEAIPIEWIICKRNEHNNDGFAWIFEAVLDDWRREQNG